MFPLQQTVDASGQFDPIGTAVVLVLLVAAAWVTRAAWRRYRAADRGYRWLAIGGGSGLLAVILVVALVLNLAAALGLA